MFSLLLRTRCTRGISQRQRTPSAHSSAKSAFPSCSYWAHCLDLLCNQPSFLSLSNTGSNEASSIPNELCPSSLKKKKEIHLAPSSLAHDGEAHISHTPTSNRSRTLEGGRRGRIDTVQCHWLDPGLDSWAKVEGTTQSHINRGSGPVCLLQALWPWSPPSVRWPQFPHLLNGHNTTALKGWSESHSTWCTEWKTRHTASHCQWEARMWIYFTLQ